MFQLQNTFREQLNEVAICQMQSFPDSFGTKLGRGYTKKSLEWFLAGENRFLFHVLYEDKVVGYCGGFQSKGLGDGSTSGIMQYAMREAAIGMIKKPWLFFHKDIIRFYPLILKNIFKKFNGEKSNTNLQSTTNTRANAVGLVVIGVHPDHRGKGCFELLMKHFEEVSYKHGAAKITLSVKASNERAIAAYKKTGWQKGSQTDKAIEMHKWLKHE
jgi:GNAT superfamily N-acetyltransferase